jgi:hypothetical protein
MDKGWSIPIVPTSALHSMFLMKNRKDYAGLVK